MTPIELTELSSVPESKTYGACPSTKVPLPSVSFASQGLVPSAIPHGLLERDGNSRKFCKVDRTSLVGSRPVTMLSCQRLVPDRWSPAGNLVTVELNVLL